MSPKVASAATITDSIITRATFYFPLQVCFKEDYFQLFTTMQTLCPYVWGDEFRMLEVIAVVEWLDSWLVEDPVIKGSLNSNMTSIPFCTCTHVTSKIYPRPRVLTCVDSSQPLCTNPSLRLTDMSSPSHGAHSLIEWGHSGEGAHERGRHTEEEDREPPQYIQGTNPSAAAASSSLSLQRALLLLLRLFQEACCTELPPCGRERKLTTTIVDPKAFSARGTQPITYQKDRLASRGKGGYVRGGKRSKR